MQNQTPKQQSSNVIGDLKSEPVMATTGGSFTQPQQPNQAVGQGPPQMSKFIGRGYRLDGEPVDDPNHSKEDSASRSSPVSAPVAASMPGYFSKLGQGYRLGSD